MEDDDDGEAIDEDELPKKKARNESGLKQFMAAHHGRQSKNLRSSTTSITLKSQLSKNTEANEICSELFNGFQKLSRTYGITRHVASLVANAYFAAHPDGLNRFSSLQSMYNKAITEVERAMGLKTKTNTGDDGFAEIAKMIVDHCKNDIEELKRDGYLEKNIPMQLRGGLSAEMATATKKHIELLPDRMKKFLMNRLYTIAKKNKHTCVLTKECDLVQLCGALVENGLMGVQSQWDCFKTTKLMGLVKNDELVKQMVIEVIEEERAFLGLLLLPVEVKVPDKKLSKGDVEDSDSSKKRKRSDKDNSNKTIKSEIQKAVQNSKRFYKIMRYHQRLSNSMLENQDPNTASPPKWARSKPFTLLPIFKLQPASVLFDSTTLKFFCTRYLHERSKLGDFWENLMADDKNGETELKHTCMYRFLLSCFNLSIKGKRCSDFRKMVQGIESGITHDWIISGFRVNGTQMDVIFSTFDESARNVECLHKKGYNIPELAETEEQVNVLSEGVGGLQYLKETRNDLKALVKGESVRVTVVDPGYIRPVQCASAVLSAHPEATSADLCSQMLQRSDIDTWSIENAEFIEDSGRGEAKRYAAARMNSDPMFKEANDSLNIHSRSASVESFDVYWKARMDHMKTWCTLKFGKNWCNHRWWRRRARDSYHSRIADKMMHRNSARLGRHKTWTGPLPKTKPHCQIQNPEQLKKLKASLAELRATRLNLPSKTVVFFGDGTFAPGGYGHEPVPKKELLRLLCSRGLTVLLQESKTSQQCPCGKSELINATSSSTQNTSVRASEPMVTTNCRVRCHKTCANGKSTTKRSSKAKTTTETDQDCSVLRQYTDRDVLATLNMLQCAFCGLNGKPRPLHLCKSNRTHK